MPQHWLVSWTRENYAIYQNLSHSVFGVPEGHQNAAKTIEPGDRLIIYTLKEQKVRAICECVSGYYHDNSVIWPDGIYPHRVKTRLIAEGDLDYRTIRNQLEISQHGKLAPGLELKGGYKRLPVSDYRLIESAFKVDGERPPLPPPPGLSHNDVIHALETIGTLLGKTVELEWRGGEYRHDVIWKDNQYLQPSMVFEVCDKGVLEKDILALEWAIYNLRATAILATISDSDFAQAKRRISPSSGILVAKAQAIMRLRELLESDIELVKAVLKA